MGLTYRKGVFLRLNNLITELNMDGHRLLADDARTILTQYVKVNVQFDRLQKKLKDQFKKLQNDNEWLADQLGSVYCHVTNGKLSKPYAFDDVKAVIDDAYTEQFRTLVEEETQDLSEERDAALARCEELEEERKKALALLPEEPEGTSRWSSRWQFGFIELIELARKMERDAIEVDADGDLFYNYNKPADPDTKAAYHSIIGRMAEAIAQIEENQQATDCVNVPRTKISEAVEWLNADDECFNPFMAHGLARELKKLLDDNSAAELAAIDKMKGTIRDDIV